MKKAISDTSNECRKSNATAVLASSSCASSETTLIMAQLTKINSKIDSISGLVKTNDKKLDQRICSLESKVKDLEDVIRHKLTITNLLNGNFGFTAPNSKKVEKYADKVLNIGPIVKSKMNGPEPKFPSMIDKIKKNQNMVLLTESKDENGKKSITIVSDVCKNVLFNRDELADLFLLICRCADSISSLSVITQLPFTIIADSFWPDIGPRHWFSNDLFEQIIRAFLDSTNPENFVPFVLIDVPPESGVTDPSQFFISEAAYIHYMGEENEVINHTQKYYHDVNKKKPYLGLEVINHTQKYYHVVNKKKPYRGLEVTIRLTKGTKRFAGFRYKLFISLENMP